MTANSSAPGRHGIESIIVRDPDILGGRPVFRGTRALFANLEDNLTIEEIVASYPSLRRTDLVNCLKMPPSA